ncbi:MAG: serine acetyltransferase [Bacteroidota bacterium]
MEQSFIKKIYTQHQRCDHSLSTNKISNFFYELLGLLFPNFSNHPVTSTEILQQSFNSSKLQLSGLIKANSPTNFELLTQDFFDALPGIYDLLIEDVQAIYEGDPAALSKEEVIRTYPGFYAISAYRIAHELFVRNVQLIPRTITEFSHGKTGIDIHPGARIGRRFCIDHGTGVVIGETTEIGNDVKIYQGVTLGALSVNKTLAHTKRHPTINDRVIIYSGATVLGGDTIIGEDSIIGGNVWLTESVPPSTQVYYKAPNEHKVKSYN